MIKKMRSFWASLEGTAVISKRELFLEIVVCFLAGILLGVIFTPKKTSIIGSNNSGNGCHNGSNSGNEDAEDEEEV